MYKSFNSHVPLCFATCYFITCHIKTLHVIVLKRHKISTLKVWQGPVIVNLLFFFFAIKKVHYYLSGLLVNCCWLSVWTQNTNSLAPGLTEKWQIKGRSKFNGWINFAWCFFFLFLRKSLCVTVQKLYYEQIGQPTQNFQTWVTWEIHFARDLKNMPHDRKKKIYAQVNALSMHRAHPYTYISLLPFLSFLW